MDFKIFDHRNSLGKAAAEQAADAIRKTIAELGSARIVAATAASAESQSKLVTLGTYANSCK